MDEMVGFVFGLLARSIGRSLAKLWLGPETIKKRKGINFFIKNLARSILQTGE